ncbi:PREDICTED: GPI ethanolamine phosphate transferase 2 isoform X2 [Capra hircus]|uniref:GPI ethanolamine phosphate transferase 2 isoform X2 n=1 Tax=Capra hircus TaxID=9925 RepID=UPI000847AB29|nr:PREDICTED: GPI ethanolamine phosphate transferase 2 isoform X2 [Capra hircus]
MRLGSGTFAAGCVVIEVLGVALFLRGFFPAPVFSGTERQAESPAPEPSAGASSNWTELPPPLFSKVVIMLIDALRDDFVFGSKGVKFMPYTTYLVEKGSSLSFVAEAKPPTVTMPRIKALLTGSLPGFIDVVRNLNSPTLLEDNVITRAKAAGKRIIFYGDETWVKLFPKHFVEYDGTTSFFVSDYTEVDNNVTRHLDTVLKRQDWDVLILHYLGLDHIGHISGPSSPLIGPKLSEMDSILMKIHTSLLSEERGALLPSLLALCGDHGMSEAGGHGASSMEEVNTALVLISSAFERKPGDVRHPTHVQQTDLAATLSVGLGLPIPKSNTGSLMFRVVEGRPVREQLRFLHLNAVQLSKLLQENVPSYKKEPGFEQFKVSERLHRNWVRLYLEGSNSEALVNLGAKVRRQYLDALSMLRLSLTRRAAQYDVYSMAAGTVLVLEALALLLLGVPQALSSRAELDVPLLSPVSSLLFGLLLLALAALHVVVCTAADSSCYLCGLPWLAAGGVMALTAALLCAGMSALTRIFAGGQCLTQTPPQSTSRWSELDLLSFLGTVGHVLSLGASSFIEEEHQTWYFLVNTLCLALCHQIYRHCLLGDDCAPQRCPHTGEEFDGVAVALQGKRAGPEGWELSHAPKDPSSLEALRGPKRWMVLASPWLVLACCRLLRSLNQTGVQWAHRPDLGHWLTRGITEARFVYVFVLGILFTGTKDLLKSQIIAADFTARTVGLWEIHSGLVLLAALLLRPHNLPVLVLSLAVQTVMTQFIWRPLRHGAAAVTVMHYWFGQAFFYFQGNSNSIATVDVSAGFVGLDAYMEIPAMFLTAFATYSGPVLWASHLVNFLTSEASSGSALRRACFCYALVCSVPVSVYIVMVTSLRYHLFIWSVFSPKLLYEGMHLLVTAAVCIFFTAMDQTNTKS